MWFFSCFRRDPPKDPFEEDTNKAMILSQDEEERRIRRQREKEEQEEIETNKAKEESLRVEKRAEKKTRQRNRVFGTEESGRVMPSKAIMNPPPSLIICNGCNSGVDQDGIYVTACGTLWHPECLRCRHCHNPIAMHEISNLKGMFHRPCYKEHRRPNCYVCKNKFPSTEEGIRYCFHPFWQEKYCPSHDGDGTAKCCSCERLEAYETKYVMLGDGRWLCRECLECAIMDTYECNQLHLEIRDFFESLHMRIEKEFPLLLVEKEALNRAEEEERIDHQYQYEIVTRGICLSEEQIVTSISEGPKMGSNNQLIGMATETQRVVRKCEVTAILILYGLPRLLTGYILAHEMMHAYLRLKGYRNLNTVLEEGICQVLGHMWLETQRYAPIDPTAASSSLASSSRTPPVVTTSKKGDQSDFQKKLVDFCKYQIETDESPIYGLGFKKVSEMMVSNHYNLKATLSEIQRWG